MFQTHAAQCFASFLMARPTLFGVRTTVTAFAIAPALQPGSVLIGTADKGRIYSVTNDGRDTLLLQSPEGQISSLLVRNNQIYAASSNQGKLFRFGNELVTEGTFESPVRDAKLTASWGRIWWRGAGNGRSANSHRQRRAT